MNETIMDETGLAIHRSAVPGGRIRNTAWVLLGVLSGLGIVLGLGAMHGPPLVSTTAMTPATAVGVAALCYLAAAVIGVRWVSWIALPIASGVPFLGLVSSLSWWLILGLAGLALAVIGLVRAPARTLPQAGAMLVYFGVAVLALTLAPKAGLLVAAVMLAAHAGWDVIHYRRDTVVKRSFAIWCIGLDLTVAAICVVLVIAG